MGAIKERNGHDLAKVAYDLGEENADADACPGNRMQHTPQSCINNNPISSKQSQPKT